MTSLSLSKFQRLWSPIWVHKGLIIRQTLCPNCEVARLSGFFRRKKCEKVASKSKIAVRWDRVSSSKARSQCALQLCVKHKLASKIQIYKSFRTLREKFQKACQKRILSLQGNALSFKKFLMWKVSSEWKSVEKKQSNPFPQMVAGSGKLSSKKSI